MKKTIFILLLFISSLAYSQTVYQFNDITADTIQIEQAVITGSYKAVKETPFSFTSIDSKTIESNYQKQEPAILLSSTPSMNYYSDNGTGLGYIYYRLRGIDQTRINVTFNGVPMNEPEDQGIYFNNYANFLGSVGDIQIIRGVGLTKSGVSSYGGSINFDSKDFVDEFNLNSSITLGSYNTFIFDGGVGNENFFINATKSQTDGFKKGTFNDSYSTFYGIKYGNFKLYGFIGKQKNGMGWLGEPMDSIKADHQYNSNKTNEQDDFTYIHNQLHYNLNHFSVIVYHTYLNGWYDTDMRHFTNTSFITEQPINYGDLMNRIELWSNWWGTVLNYNIKINSFNSNFGVSAYTYYRDHVGSYNNEEAYTNTGNRNEVAPYLKAELKWKGFSFYGDIQYRYNKFTYDNMTNEPIFYDRNYNFFNWSAGLSYRLGDYTNVYYGIGKSNREPTRSDLFMGEDNFLGYNTITDYYNVDEDYEWYNTVPESVIDNELGIRYADNGLKLNANLYYMHFRNEIVLNGDIGTNSILQHKNVDESFRSGIEFDGSYSMYNGLSFNGVGSYSYNRIEENGETFEPILSPSIILIGDIKYNYKNKLYIGLNARYDGESYIDFSNEHVLESMETVNLYVGIIWKGFEFAGYLNNITSSEYSIINAVMGYDGNPRYFAGAGINYMMTLKYKF